MCFLYILPWLRKNVFKRVLQGFDRIGFGFGVSGTSAAVPGVLPGYPRQAMLLVLCLALVCQIIPGGVASMGSRDGAGRTRTPRKCTTSQKLHQNRFGLNRKNLKKIAEI